MSDEKQLEAWVRRVARSEELKAAREAAEAAPPSEVELVRYYAGLLSPEDERAVAARIALDESSVRYLAELESDVEAAAAAVRPRWWGIASLRSRVAASLPTRPWAMRLAGATAATVGLLALGVWMLDRPPEVPATAYASPLLERTRGGQGPAGLTVVLPDGTVLPRVDPNWPIVRPAGEVEAVKWFVWSPVTGAKTYRFRLYDAAGRLLLDRAGLTRCYQKLSWSLRRDLEPGREYIWTVELEGLPEAAAVRASARFRVEASP